MEVITESTDLVVTAGAEFSSQNQKMDEGRK